MQITQNNNWKQYYNKDPEACFRMLFENYYAPLVMVSNHFIKDLSEAEDVVQQLFLNLWEKNKLLEITGSLEAYLYTAVRNASFNILQRRKQIIPAAELELLDRHLMQSLACLLDNECAAIIELAMNQLSEQNRRAFELVYVENQTYKQASLTMDISINTIKYHLKHALKTLRENKNLRSYFSEK